MRRKTLKTLIRCARPSFLLLTPCCLSIAFAFAFAEGHQVGLIDLVLILTGALLAHSSVNLFNEYYDFRSGLDSQTLRTPFSGGSGALPADPGCAEAVRLAGQICLLITILIGLYFIQKIGWGLLPLGLAGVMLVYFYSPQITRHPLLCLLAPGLGFGPVMILGAYYLLSGQHLNVLPASLIVLLLVSNLLLLNQFPDLEPDRNAGRLHFPILFGRQKSALVYVSFLILAYGLLLVSVYLAWLPTSSLLALATLPLAIPVSILVLRFHDDIPKLIPAMGLNVALTLSMPVALALGIAWPAF